VRRLDGRLDTAADAGWTIYPRGGAFPRTIEVAVSEAGAHLAVAEAFVAAEDRLRAAESTAAAAVVARSVMGLATQAVALLGESDALPQAAREWLAAAAEEGKIAVRLSVPLSVAIGLGSPEAVDAARQERDRLRVALDALRPVTPRPAAREESVVAEIDPADVDGPEDNAPAVAPAAKEKW
jgi:hypothetical protein